MVPGFDQHEVWFRDHSAHEIDHQAQGFHVLAFPVVGGVQVLVEAASPVIHSRRWSLRCRSFHVLRPDVIGEVDNADVFTNFLEVSGPGFLVERKQFVQQGF